MENESLHEARAGAWYSPARFGLFYHWGLYTGGGSTSKNDLRPLTYTSIEEFEAAAGDPDAVAENMVRLAKGAGARYITYTLLHSCDGYALMYPSRLLGIRLRTTRDYAGALIERCHREGLGFIGYFPIDSSHGDTPGGPWLDERYRSDDAFIDLMKDMVSELAERHGSKIGGFWLDGAWGHEIRNLPQHIHRALPGALVICNNDTARRTPDMDISTTEFLAAEASPAYNRPSGLNAVHPRWGMPPAPRDYNEDIPTCNGWWHGGAPDDAVASGVYAANPTYWIKEMISSLGQRGQWNYAMGIGPRIDGTAPPLLAPMLDRMGAFLAWAGEAIYDTTGGEGAPIPPGWWPDGAFGSVTVSLKDPTVLYLHVTTPPNAETLRVPHRGVAVEQVTDLRTGEDVPFQRNEDLLTLPGGPWDDIAEHGARVLRVRLSAPR